MQFNSIQFIFYFLPVFLAVYYILPANFGTTVLAAGSFLFYGFAVGWDPLALGVLFAAFFTAFFGGMAAESEKRRWVFWPAVFCLGMSLVFFKLFLWGILLPVGMSFYVFQLIAYLADVYRGKIRAERDVIDFFAEVFLFPKLLSGPIASSRDLQKYARRPHRKLFTFHMGLQEFILGLGLKVVLANRLGGVWAQGSTVGFEQVSTPYAWLAAVTFSMRLYFDFYGYSLMAVGLGHMVGWNLPMNFLEPYSAKTVSDFYRRWHATLGRWFRDYIYIPLGGSRRGTARTLLNLAVVWALTGFWHGVGGGYMMWAGILFALIAAERLFLKKPLEKSRVVCHIYLILAIVLSWVPFAAGSAGEAVTVFSRLFAVGGVGMTADFLDCLPKYAWLLAGGVFFATPLPRKLWGKLQKTALADVFLFFLFWACLYLVATARQDPFIYFDF